MEQILTVKKANEPIYDIMIESDYSKLQNVFEMLDVKEHKICIVSDSNVSSFYLNEVMSILEKCASKVISHVFLAGEASKTLETVQGVYEHLIQEKFDRNDILVALGGGVVGDLTGYTAATYLRGIRFVQMPTSLLAMVDSSIGGKTGVDFLAYKNMVGAFHQPKAVYINVSTLSTLSMEHYFNGFGEVIKYGLIQDGSFFNWLKENEDAIKKQDMNILSQVVYESCKFKRAIVEKDPEEKNIRAFLNFGHTLGHSIEKWSDFSILHGQCVALGMVAASFMSMKRGMITETELKDIVDVLSRFELPTNIEDLPLHEIVNGTKNDKKMDSGKIKFILIDGIGNAIIDKSVTDEEMMEALSFLIS